MKRLFLVTVLVLSSFLKIVAQAPTITTFSPASGSVGSLVTITGTDFTGVTSVTLGTTSAIIISNTGTTLTCLVMPGSTSNTISLTSGLGTGTSASSFTVVPSQILNAQQGSKLVGSGNTGTAFQGSSVSLSADGNTAIVGGQADNTNQGAAWIYTKTGSTWSQQGSKLVGTGAIGAAQQGISVSLSADGNTAIVGGNTDNTNQGAAWIFTRTGSTWTQQGNKLVGTGNTGAAQQGYSVSLSADGNTAIVGGFADNTNQGAAWIYTRTGNTWAQQGSKLVATGNTGAAQQGVSVSLSADGNTAIVGGNNDNTNQGAAWIYARTGSTWTQQGSKLVGTGNTGTARQGYSVSLSADGNTAIVGGYSDNTNQGAAWIYTRTGSTWTQQGNKLVGTGNTGAAFQGWSVSLSSDGNSALVGGFSDNSDQGAAWIFTRTGSNWTQQGNKLVGTGNAGTARQGYSVSLSADGNTAIVGGYADNTNRGAVWIYTFKPVITSFTPNNGSVGTTVTITGVNFTGTTSVSIGGTASAFTVVNDNTITATVASGTISGTISVTSPGGTGTSVAIFSLPSSINSFTPSSGAVGSLITISGTSLAGVTAVSLGSTSAIIVSNTGTILTCLVMPGSTSNTISLTSASGSVTSASSFTVVPSQLVNTQQGSKLVGTGNTGAARQGYSVSLSADGNTAIVGGISDNSNQGAAWIYTRTGSNWTQQGSKLVGTGAIGTANQGYSVSLSADGNTAIVGGYTDNTNVGAAWIYTRSGTTWSQQGSKLVGTGAIGAALQGYSVSLSSDGNTAIVGGYNDNSTQGAAWIFTRTGSTWAQQGSKLVGTGAVGTAQQGRSVALSADGNTAIVGGYNDNSTQGAAWIYTRSGTTWSQQGSKLVGTGNTGAARQGYSVSLSADGNTAIVGGNSDNTNQGAAWIYTRTGSAWSQQGSKLVGTGNIGAAQQGSFVSLSADGNRAIVGGNGDSGGQGAAWIYARSGTIWTQQDNKLVGTGNNGAANQGFSVALSADGNTAIVGGYTDNTNVGAAWMYTFKPAITSFSPTNGTIGTTVTITGFNFTGATDVSIGGTTASAFTVVNDNTITATVASGTVAGTISVTSPNGSGTSVAIFSLPSIISSFTPSFGAVGSLITISGTSFAGVTSVALGSTSAIIVSNTGTTLTCLVMPGSTSNTISLTSASGTATSASSFTIIPSIQINAQQGNKLVGTGNTGAAQQGYSVSISADGNTAIVGGYGDNSQQGAAWIYTRTGSVWTQQGSKLVGTGAIGSPNQGYSVSLSADGNTAIVGGYGDNSQQGAAWIYTRSGTTWSQQGSKLVGTGAIGVALQGWSVSLSADGNTAIVGGYADNTSLGAAWIYTRSGTTWTQQGSKLVGTGAIGVAQQGSSVSLSADGNTAILGGFGDNSNAGAVWIFTRTGTTWSQQGSKLVGTGAAGTAQQGRSVSLSADGNTALVGGNGDNLNQGAAWIFTRSGTTWTQQGSKLVGTGAAGTAQQGRSVSLSADGNTALVGGNADNTSQGAVWIYTRTGSTWTQQGNKLVGTGNTGAAQQGWSVSLSADGNTAIVGGFGDNSGLGAVWIYTFKPVITSFTPTNGNIGTTVTITGVNFTGATDVSIGGTTASAFTVVNDNTITATVASGTVAGTISVTSPNGTGTSVAIFSLPSTMSSFTPTSGVVGSLITISGTNLAGVTAVSLGSTSAIIISNTGTTLTCLVMPGSTSSTISLTSASGTVTSASSFTIIPSQIISAQQGNKLVGTGNTGAARQGFCVSLSADGNTAIVGSNGDNSFQGAAWIYTRTGSAWTQQGSKLVGTDNTGAAFQGISVSLSADGNTAIVGGYNDNSGQGAAWIFTRTGSIWSQQGNKLVGTGNTGAANQGRSVSLSADGNTAIVGGYGDNSGQGAAWIYTRTGSTWTQQGNKLVGTGNIGAANQGWSVSLSADGNTAIVGGYADNTNQGAAWIYTRTGSTWTQQGSKLVGTGGTVTARQGISVSLSADGNTAIFGGSADNSNQGAAWIYTRTGSTWTQQGNKLVATGNTGAAEQGISVSLSADGNTAIFGGYSDNTQQGSVWIYTRTGSTWTQQGNKLVGTGNTGAAQQGYSVSISADGNTAIAGGWTDNTQQGAAWIYIVKPSITSFTPNNGNIGTTVTINGVNFTGATDVSIGGTTASTFTVVNDNTITATVASGTVAGTISVTTPFGTGTSVAIFSLPSTVSSFTPSSGAVGSLINISGTSLAGVTAVSLGSTSAIIVSNTGTTLTCLVMPGSTSSIISLTSASGTVTSASSFTVIPSQIVNTQQGSKLVGTGGTATAQQGWSVSLSADGKTAIVGGYTDNTNQGAAWIYTRTGSTWTQQGSKLVGTGNTGAAQQGRSVSLSADGNTAIVGGWTDNANQGAAWIFTRIGSIWSQQGNKLVGTGNTGAASQGTSVSLSADGNTAIVGGYLDNSNQGAAWMYTRTGSTWTQQGSKLVGTGGTATAQQGYSVSLSADGNTAIVGGYADNSNQGAAWIYTRTGSAWTQQGSKLVGTGNIGAARQGWSVSLSADGNTAVVGGYNDNSSQGAAWIFTRAGSTWTQQGSKLVGTVNIGAAFQGWSVSLSADGNTAIVGGYNDNSSQGAAWIYTRAGSTWTQQGNKLVGTGNTGAAQHGYSLSLSADGNTAIVGGNADNTNQGAVWIYTFKPVITSFTPNNGSIGTTVNLTGVNFTGATSVSIGGITVSSFTVLSDNSITATVASGTVSGAISVTSPNGTGTSVAIFSLPSTISSFTPTSGSVGSLITISGTSLAGVTAVSLGSTSAIIVSNTGTTLSCLVMPGSASNTISLTSASGTVTSASSFTIIPSQIINAQQGNKLVGTGNTGAAQQGFSVSLSADGNTAIVGGYNDNSLQGAAWIYTKTGSTWTQQGNKLVGTGNTGAAQQGISVSLSADGNTAIVGGWTDNSSQGAAWIFIRSGSTWTQQGNKLVGTGAIGAANQGSSVSLSADGNTAIVGGQADNTIQGAAWIFTRTGSNWTQQGNKLVGTGNAGTARQGYSVSLSEDGNTAIVGGYADNINQGAAWIYTRTGSTWSQQGSKLVGTGNTGAAQQGYSVSLSADGNTAIVGGRSDNSSQGAAWVYIRTGSTWAQQGSKLVGTGNTGAAQQGISVSLSADGNRAIVGGYTDNTNQGAAWIFTRTGSAWTQQGNKLVGTGNTGAARQGSSVSLSADGNTAIVGGQADNTNQGAAWIYTFKPVISSFTPNNGSIGTTVTITGINFNGATAVSIGGTSASAFTVVNDNTITATVASGAVSGTISVTSLGGTGTSVGVFSILTSSNADLSAMTISAGTLNPVFASATTTYTANVSNATSNITISSTVAEPNAIIEVRVNGGGYATVASGSASSELALNVGTNPIDVKVTAQDGTTTKTYTTTVTRASSSNADLSSMTISAGTLNPVFASATTTYTASVSNATSNITISSTVAEPNATIEVRVNGGGYATVASGSASSALALNVGTNPIDVKVTAQDGTTIKTYTTIVTRADISTITSFGPTIGPVGTIITITGTNLSGTTAVSIGGTAVASFVVDNNSTITAVLASGSTGIISVTTPLGIATSGSTFTYIPAPTQFTVTGGGNYCTGGTGMSIGLNGSEIGLNYQLILGGSDIGSPIAGTGTSLDFGLQTLSGTYTVKASNAIYPAVFATMTGNAIVSLSTTNTWIGATGSLWSLPSNWSCGAVPNIAVDVTIPNGASIVISDGSNVNARNISIGATGSLAFTNTGTLQLAGNWQNAGTFTPGNGTVEFVGTNQTIDVSAKPNKLEQFNNLQINTGTVLTLATNSQLSILPSGALTVNGIFDANHQKVYFDSDSARAARLAELPTGAILSNAENFIIERYFTKHRRLRYLSSPVINATIQQWKDSTLIAGPRAGGFDAPYNTTTSLKHYNEASTLGINNAWLSQTNVNNPLVMGRGYYFFVIGKRTTVFPDSANVTLALRGIPNTGTLNLPVTFTTTGTLGWNLVGNPYASQISWNATGWTKTNIGNAIYMWDPLIGKAGNYYSYVNGIASDGRANGDVIASSQGFFVKANAANPVLQIRESVKVGSTHQGNFRQASLSDIVRLKISFGSNSDQTVVYLQEGATRDVDESFDALKLIGGDMNIYTAAGATNYSIQALPATSDTFSVSLQVASNYKGSHLLSVTEFSSSLNSEIYLLDSYTNKAITITEGFTYAFDPAVTTSKRFKIANYLPKPIITDIGYELSENHSSILVYPNPTVHGLTVQSVGKNDVLKSIEVYSVEGILLLKKENLNISTCQINELSDYSEGVYLVKVFSEKTQFQKLVTKQ